MHSLRMYSFRRSLLALALALAVFAFTGAGEDARFNKVGHQLMCMCGCNQVLLECNHVGCAYSTNMRNQLTTALERGESDGLTLQSFVQSFGPTVLVAPTTTGFNLVAWIVPFAALFTGFGLTIVLVNIWKSRPAAAPARTAKLSKEELDEARRKARKDTEL